MGPWSPSISRGRAPSRPRYSSPAAPGASAPASPGGSCARVLVCGRSEPAELPSADGRTAVFAKADIRDPEQAAGSVQHAVDLFQRLDVVVSNAGGSPYAAAATASPRFHAKVDR